MTRPTHLILVAAIAFVAGAIMSFAYFKHVFQGYSRSEVKNGYSEIASYADLYVRQLTELRNGDTNRAIGQLEMLLDDEIIRLSSYEKRVPPSERQQSVYKTLAEASVYREKYPSDLKLAGQRSALAAALALGRKRQR